MLQFPHRLQGYSPKSVEEAFEQVEAQYSQESTRLKGELAAARQTTAELRTKLARLEMNLQDAESRIKEDMVITLQVHRQGAEMLEAVTQRHAQQQRLAIEATVHGEQQLRQLHGLQNAFLRELAELVHRHRRSAGAAIQPSQGEPGIKEGL